MHASWLAPLALALGAHAALAASWGVSDGSLSGVVLDQNGSPVSGAWVVAQRTDQEPRVIRSTRSDAQGRYYLGVPTGAYTLGFSHPGFETIDTSQGDENNQTALGAQVRTFIEPGRNSVIQDISLEPRPPQGTGTAVVSLVDAVTGDSVGEASVIVGTAATSSSSGGVFRLEVPARVGEEGEVEPAPVEVQADGYQRYSGEVTVVPLEEQRYTFPLQPRLALLTGFVELDPTIDPARVQDIRVIVSRVPDAIGQGRVLTSSGYFEVQVPASTATNTRSFDLRFVLENATIATLPGVIAPRGGASQISAPVRVEAVKTEVTGNVVSSDGTLPVGGRITQAVILELGRSVPVTGGAFTLTGVPVGRPLTLQVTVENPTTGQIETGEATFTAASGGDVFHVPPVITRPR